jgi:hypothetical protein
LSEQRAFLAHCSTGRRALAEDTSGVRTAAAAVRNSWEGGHALKRGEERGKDPAAVEKLIRSSVSVAKRADGRYNIDGCIGGEITRVVVAEVRSDAIVVVTVFGRGAWCN